jgi:hypothetical protein
MHIDLSDNLTADIDADAARALADRLMDITDAHILEDPSIDRSCEALSAVALLAAQVLGSKAPPEVHAWFHDLIDSSIAARKAERAHLSIVR